MRFGLIASAIYLLQATYAARSSIKNVFVTEVSDAMGNMQTANCQCDCACVPIVENPCQVDLYVMLDAAICVKDIWEEMKFRVDNLLLKINDKHVIGNRNSVRVSISMYANSYRQVIEMSEGMSYKELSHKMSEMSYLNEGSYLDKGLEGISQVISQEVRNNPNRNRAVLFITNGKSHKTVENRDIMPQLNTLRNMVNGRLYFNTLVDIAEYKDCEACDINRILLNVAFGRVSRHSTYYREGESLEPGLLVKTDDYVEVDSIDVEHSNMNNKQYYGAVISKLDLVKYFVPEVDYICDIVALNKAAGAVKEKQDCTQCTCQCESLPGPDGPPGIRGEPGPDGCPGCDGEPGEPGKDGRCGLDGPDGIPGIPGRPGSPGAHGHPGVEGPKGPKGENGEPGVPGAPGNPGGPGQPGKRGGLGRPGTPGPDGNPGDIGGPGQPGNPGPAGHPGPQGGPGQPGSRGNNGRPGSPGPRGAPGINGARGETGAPGPNGNPGQDGAPGERGFEGRQGRQGPAGENGSDGPAGSPGITGNPGKVGRDGRLGRAPSDNEIRAKIRAYLEQILPAHGDNMIKNSPYECANFRSSLYMEILARFAGSSGSASSFSYSSSNFGSSSYSSGSSGSYNSGSSNSYSSGSSGSYSSSYSSGSSNNVDSDSYGENNYSYSNSQNNGYDSDDSYYVEANHDNNGYSMGYSSNDASHDDGYYVEVDANSHDNNNYNSGSSASWSSGSSYSSSGSSYSGSSSYSSGNSYNYHVEYAEGDEIDAAEAELDAEESSHEYSDDYQQYYDEAEEKELY